MEVAHAKLLEPDLPPAESARSADHMNFEIGWRRVFDRSQETEKLLMPATWLALG
jgi:hypothetical protein